MRKPIVTTALAFAAMLAAAPAAPAAVAAPSADYVPGELLVRFEGGRERLVELPEGVAVGDAARALGSNPAVAYANPNYLARASSVPNDPGLGAAPGDWRGPSGTSSPAARSAASRPPRFRSRPAAASTRSTPGTS